MGSVYKVTCLHSVTARAVNLDKENLGAFFNSDESFVFLDVSSSAKTENFGLDELQNQFRFKMHLKKILFEQILLM